MMKSQAFHPSEAELEILEVLWRIEPASVREIHEILSQSKQVGYTTTLKQIQRMLDKGMVSRTGSGKSHQYSAVAKKSEVRRTLFQKFVDSTFEGSAMDLVMHALGQKKASPEELEKLMQFLEKQKSKDHE
ncbi:MAG: BlaI/MecI/CopY family transcriptional regulator [Bacteroidota bacterium]